MRQSRVIWICVLSLIALRASAVNIEHITTLQGQQRNVLTGLGLVIGLKGTGDGGDFQPAIKPLAAMLAKFADPATVRELNAVKNVALVAVSVSLPPRGALMGDELDVFVQSIGSASSIQGGRLFVTPLVGTFGELNEGMYPFAIAQGTVKSEDLKIPTSGIIKGGAVMQADLLTPSISNAGSITLILQDPAASWTTADAIAKVINDAEGNGEPIAVARSAKAVEVMIPAPERERPATFISRIQGLPVEGLGREARVVINQRTGTIIMTGDVEISPVVISHKGLTITTVNPPPKATDRNPQVVEKAALGIDTRNKGGARLQELVNALDAIKVPAEDRITIIEKIYESGQLHAKLIRE